MYNLIIIMYECGIKILDIDKMFIYVFVALNYTKDIFVYSG